ncbi:hypothetical protein POM88_001224 [Heracleum sosnowskyi]|uniref:Uncharacterized protein n=1 Tax=Heracleum sosnowskyi TaxID=360622 RepID=A0AAD8JCK4_9APIA|nr:hypothetical protein POM88_001224 [Heracleum sosnowskyi]
MLISIQSGCDTCPTEVDENYKCDSCDLKIVSIPDKRFKVPMHVSDGSETIQVFLLDREVRRLISRSVDSFFGHDDKNNWIKEIIMLGVCWVGFLLHYWRVGLGLEVHKRTKNGSGLFGLRCCFLMLLGSCHFFGRNADVEKVDSRGVKVQVVVALGFIRLGI